MVKQKSYAYNDRGMNEYKKRTSYENNYQPKSSENNQVRVVHSSRCCRSKKTNIVSPKPITKRSQTPQLTAHEKTHLRLDSPDTIYYYSGRINKTNINRMKKSYPIQNRRNKIRSDTQPTFAQQSNKNSTIPVQSTTKKKNSCCTIL